VTVTALLDIRIEPDSVPQTAATIADAAGLLGLLASPPQLALAVAWDPGS
jgi:hypothetical protein